MLGITIEEAFGLFEIFFKLGSLVITRSARLFEHIRQLLEMLGDVLELV